MDSPVIELDHPAPLKPQNAATEPVLAVAGLTTAFRREGEWHSVVRNLSFAVAPKQTVAIVGESGSGKSVTALSIMRLIPPQSGRIAGSIRLAGRDLLTLSDKAMRQVRGNDVAMIFQEPMTSLNPVLTVGFQIAEALIYHQAMPRTAAEAEAIRLLDKVRIPSAASRFHEYPHRLSGGMRQRVMIAMALACRPRLLIADEPTTALDVTIQAQILALIAEIREELGTAVVFITHDLGVVAEIADRVAVLYAGKVVEQSDVFTLFDGARHPYTRGLMRSTPRLAAGTDRLTEIRGMVPPPNALPSGCAFAPRCEQADERCQAEPPLAPGAGGRRVACWHPAAADAASAEQVPS